MTVTIKIENNNLDKAKVEVEALLVYINELAKTYTTTFKEPVEEAPVEKPKRKPRAKKAPVEEAPVEEAPVEEAPVEEAPVEEVTGITLEELTAIGKKAVASGKRDEAKTLIGEYSTSGKLSSVPEDKYSELAEKLGALC